MTRKSEARWEMLNHAMHHYQQYIQSKKKPFSLSIVDLLFISNFKGGNASITEPLGTLQRKLKKYEKILVKINESFEGKTLSSLNSKETKDLIQNCDEFLQLTLIPDTKIRGFGPSYSSALLAAYFFELIPVLDRRVLNGAKIDTVKDSQKQVKNIERYYGELILAFQQNLKENPVMTLRELDKIWFIIPIENELSDLQ